MNKPGNGAPVRGLATPPEMHPGDEARPGTPGTGEDTCRHCRGTGRVGGDSCPNCEGTGIVIEGIGGA
jgi:hypothetical protein